GLGRSERFDGEGWDRGWSWARGSRDGRLGLSGRLGLGLALALSGRLRLTWARRIHRRGEQEESAACGPALDRGLCREEAITEQQQPHDETDPAAENAHVRFLADAEA